MNAFSDALSVTASGLKAQAARLRVVTENISNVDTPGYRRKVMPFKLDRSETALVRVEPGRVRLDQSDLEQIYDPSHPLADANGNYQGTNVDLLIELADAREAQRSYEANLKMFDQTRQMSSGLLELLRR
ncbi:flagellar basal body rod protein FlgC [Tropicibacter naphthalenivorans]|uniref:Putative proximal rod protein n=1 Tax=Tropicibacter naphthalenivorans TaxID=441103 RepID=A0A0N7M080_9RHOB|nr:flagellar basal body rod protein FlgC [Tropicibacter naphthalenivorans]CUH79721.1 Putative proximal rod protein [Tropicibacter naphthalenivorans]SMC74765.1 flagellar basal-body rod protein FlgC [Tropicibacter naphthalenivorans]